MAAFRRRLLTGAVLLLVFSLMVVIFPTGAIPTPRLTGSIKTIKYQKSVDDFHPKDLIKEDMRDIKMEDQHVVMERRMDMELSDYPGTGANNHHDPTPPRTRV